jgi:hypothetical protein
VFASKSPRLNKLYLVGNQLLNNRQTKRETLIGTKSLPCTPEIQLDPDE